MSNQPIFYACLETYGETGASYYIRVDYDGKRAYFAISGKGPGELSRISPSELECDTEKELDDIITNGDAVICAQLQPGSDDSMMFTDCHPAYIEGDVRPALREGMDEAWYDENEVDIVTYFNNYVTYKPD